MWLYYFCLIAATMGLPTLMFMSQRAEAAAVKARKEGIANGTIDPNPNVQLAKEKAQREQMKIDARNAKAAAFQPGKGRVWSHTPSNLTLLWLAISVPLVIWDTGYVLLRPHSMPGGKYHWPLWVPYELYGRTDYVYGWKAWNEHNGFTAAQGWMNVVETLGYIFYMYIVYTNGRQSAKQGRGAPADTGVLSESRTLKGQAAGLAVLVGYSASIMTVSKTVLYWLNEYHSGFENIGHNDITSLIFLWIIPNGAWLVLPTYMSYVFGSEMLQGLAIASGEFTQAEDNTKTLKAQ